MQSPDQNKLRLFSVFHKPFIMPSATYVQPIVAGKARGSALTGMPGDDTGDNISLKNPFYSELTVLYWIWKNADRSLFQYWGVVHYRRYFCRDVFPGQFTNKRVYHHPATKEALDTTIDNRLYAQLTKSLHHHDVVMPKLMYSYRKKGVTRSIEWLYKELHIPEHWEVMIAVLKELYPDYDKSLSFFGQSKMHFFNMMIAPWAIWDEYLDWLFSILFEVEKRIGPVDDPYQARVFGFLSERMINLFVHHKRYKVAQYPIAVFGQ